MSKSTSTSNPSQPEKQNRKTTVGPKTAKKQAKACKEFLASKEVDLQLSDCQEMVAQAVHGARNWSSLLGGKVAQQDEEFVDDMDLPINARRANWAFQSLVEFGNLTGAHPDMGDPGETEAAIKDLLSDLRHLCDRLNLDYDDIAMRSESCYHEEVSDECMNETEQYREKAFKAADMYSVINACADASDIVDRLCMVSDDEILKVKWTDLGEGYNGDYNEEDPDDLPLLRFDVSAKVCEATEHLFMDGADEGEWAAVHDASYCTNMPATADPEILVRALATILKECHDAVSGGGQVRKVGETMSWIGPDDFAV